MISTLRMRLGALALLACTVGSTLPAGAASAEGKQEAGPEGRTRTVTAVSVDAAAPAGSLQAIAVPSTGVTPVVNAPAQSGPRTPPAYRGSSVGLRNVVTAIGFDRAAQPTYNPYYAMQLTLGPRYWLSDTVYARGSFDVSTELTQADWTNDRFFWSDLGLGVGADGFYKIPGLGVGISAEASLSLPTSKASRAATRVLAGAASWSFSRKFGLFGVGYEGNVEKYFNRYTSGAPTAFLVGPCGESSRTGCIDLLVQTGRRNASWSVGNSLNASLQAKPWLGFSAGVGMSTAFLYDLPETPGVSLEIEDPTSARYFLSTNASLSLKPSDLATVVLGARSSHGQLAPSGGYQTPFINRHTQVFLDLRLNVANLLSR